MLLSLSLTSRLRRLSRLLLSGPDLVLLLPLGRRPPQCQQLRGPRVEGVLEPLDPAVVELDLLSEAGELAVALGEAGGQLLLCVVRLIFSLSKSEFYFFPLLSSANPWKKKKKKKKLSPRS